MVMIRIKKVVKKDVVKLNPSDLKLVITDNTTNKLHRLPSLNSASNSNNFAKRLEAIGEILEKSGITADISKWTGFVATVGTNGKIYISGWQGNQYETTLEIAENVSKFAFTAGIFVDFTLSSTINPQTQKPYQSWGETMTNTGIGALSMYVGGPAGILIGVYYTSKKGYVKTLEKHPEFAKDGGEWLH